MVVVPWQRLKLARHASFGARSLLNPLTSRIVLRVRRQTPQGVMFPAGSILRARTIVRAGTSDFVSTGCPQGGERPDYRGGIHRQYASSWGLPWGFFGDRDRPRRLGEQRSGRFDVSVEFELDGDPIDTQWQLETIEERAPQFAFHNSVAIDTFADKGEVAGGSIIDIASYTSTGSDRGMFIGVGNSAGIPVAVTAAEYNNVVQTEIWDELQSNVGSSGWYGVNQPTGAQLVEGVFASSPDEAVLAIISMTGVDQTTPCNVDAEANHLHKLGSGNTSMTKTAPGTITSDDLVIGFTYIAHSADPAIAQGADQTERTSEKPASGVHGALATQPGSVSPAVMSVTMAGSAFGAIHGVVAFKASAAAAGGGPLLGGALRGTLVGGSLVAG